MDSAPAWRAKARKVANLWMSRCARRWPHGRPARGARRCDVAGLVVEEKVGLELAQELALGQAAEEHRLVDLDVPVHQGADGALVRRRCCAR
jgi:hypothetical protein